MVTATTVGRDDALLRDQSYNAQVVDIRRCHDDLMVMRVRPDRGIPPFTAGQYVVLGLGNWEPRVEGVQPESNVDLRSPKLIKRAYSISNAMLDGNGELVRAILCDSLEFYITLIRQAEGQAPALTPRLFGLGPGDRIYCGPHPHGNYTLRGVQRDDNVVFAATGTGEAPHNAMLAELLSARHRGLIAAIACVRLKRDLGYLAVHRALERRYPTYRYIALTTREPENLQPTTPGYVGKRYLQDYLDSGDFEHEAGFALDSKTAHVFICGSPTMIGVPHHTHAPASRHPKPTGLVEVLERRGFCVDRPHEPGNIHFEKYW